MAKKINEIVFSKEYMIESAFIDFVNITFCAEGIKKTNFTFAGKVMQNEEFVKKFFDLIACGLKIDSEVKADVKNAKR